MEPPARGVRPARRFRALAGLALHDREAGDRRFLATLPIIERTAPDERNFVRKGVSWALRVLGRRNRALNEAAVDLANRLAESEAPAARAIGKEARRELTGPVVRRALARKER